MRRPWCSFPLLPRYMCRFGIAGWIDTSLRLAGADAPTVDHTECVHDGAEVCRYQLFW